MTKPSINIEAAADGLRWKVVHEGRILGGGTAQSMQAAQSAADRVALKVKPTTA